MSRIVRAALLQSSWAGDKESMLDFHEEYARKAAAAGAQVLCFYELMSTPYMCQTENADGFAWAESLDGPTVTRMQSLARETGMVLVVPIYEVTDTGLLYNTAVVIDADGTVRGKYRKNHIPQIAGAAERFYFRRGDLGWPVFDTAIGRIGVSICYDRHFPEGWRALGLAGAEIVFNPSSTVRSMSTDIWKIEQPAAAVANQFFIGAVNRVGVEGGSDFYGSSYFVEPTGKIVGDVASDTSDELVVRDLDLQIIDEWKEKWTFYQDLRLDSYDSTMRRPFAR